MLRRLNFAEKMDAMDILFKEVRPDLASDDASKNASKNVLMSMPHGTDSVSIIDQISLGQINQDSPALLTSRSKMLDSGLLLMLSRSGKSEGVCNCWLV